MSTSPLPNYLRAHRKQLGLNQRDLAFLLGDREGTTVSRHEHFVQEPTLRHALAYELLLGQPVAILFGGLMESERVRMDRRLEELLRQMSRDDRGGLAARKVKALSRIVETLSCRTL